MLLVFRLYNGSVGSSLSLPFPCACTHSFPSLSLQFRCVFPAGTFFDHNTTYMGILHFPKPLERPSGSNHFIYCVVPTIYFSPPLLALMLPGCIGWTVCLAGSGSRHRALAQNRGSENIHCMNEWLNEWMHTWINENNCHCVQFHWSLHILSMCQK